MEGTTDFKVSYRVNRDNACDELRYTSAIEKVFNMFIINVIVPIKKIPKVLAM